MRALHGIKLGFLSLALLLGWALMVKPRGRSMEGVKEWIARDFPEVVRIQTADLDRWKKNPTPGNGEPLLVDVRTPEEYEVSHLPGALLFDPASRANEFLRIAPTNRPAVFYCSVGYRAAQAARRVRSLGWTNVVVLEGSIFQWAIEKRPLESEGRPTKWVHPHSASYVRLLPPENRAPLPQLVLILNEVPPLERFRLGVGIFLLVIFLVWESLAPAFHWFRAPRERFLHGWRNYFLGLFNVVLAGLLFVQLWLLAANWADLKQFGLLHWMNAPAFARVAGAILLLDLWTYCWHRLNHAIPFLWRFHRTHHTELQMDVSSAVRFHFGEIILSSLLRIPIILLLGLRFHEIVLYEALLFAVVQFHHANIQLNPAFDRWLRRIIVTPGFHRVHHSVEWNEANSNYSSLFSWWDRVFRTDKELARIERFGVKGFLRPELHTVVGLVESPLEDGEGQ